MPTQTEMPSATEDTPLMGITRRVTRRHSVDADGTAKGRIRGLLTRAKTRISTGGGSGAGISQVLSEIENEEERGTRFLLFAIFCITNHVLGGAITLHFLEGWTLYDAAYFCIVTTTTVGYGDITPTKMLSKIYVMYYVIVSIGLISTLLSYLVGLLLDQQEELLLAAIVQEEPDEMDDFGDSDLEDARDDRTINERIMHATRRLDLSDYYGLFFSSMILVGIIVLGVVVFMKLEKLSIVDAMYTTIISATTVGFGDFEPTRNVSKMIMTVWLCFSTICVAKVVADFTEANVKAKQRAMSRRLLTASMDLEALRSMDSDKSGSVDKVEFLTEMLVRTGKIERKDIDAFLLRFEQLDKNSSGLIDVKECV